VVFSCVFAALCAAKTQPNTTPPPAEQLQLADAIIGLEDPGALTIEDESASVRGKQGMKEEYDFRNAKRGAVLPTPSGKERITIRLDADVLEWFRHQAEAQGGGNYQTMINQALREYILRQDTALEDLLRRVVREELAQYKP
jgi:uncharacterized protein (DUF4415 family)